ncbi:GNAT family N-acetyltransferase [Celeribacter indicus]|uniref:Putative ribosomal-protein-alanine acetyltransferase n=1 Tax=Celeribacter indicus TaxID=1208324 RepID=A0A0B5E8B3_9RHOB|nr:GNAT family N-acetyltransferase [Celeribacter indicus]AJE48557.1 putative ribosomal-protein-alanine acetyltransferase [Celeribacter indicus]SDX08381.1 ribosomal-protein-alanine N-acetyltransferase [Celeribacter indicus]
MSAFGPARLAEIHTASFTTPRPWSERDFAELLPLRGVFLVTCGGPGFALGRAVAGEAELLTIAVMPDARGQGAGRRLLRDYEATAQAAGARMSFLEVAEDNLPAITLYRSAGYRESGRRGGYYVTPDGDRIDALLLEKRIGEM